MLSPNPGQRNYTREQHVSTWPLSITYTFPSAPFRNQFTWKMRGSLEGSCELLSPILSCQAT
jgi:hypothetical protein